MNLEFGLIGGTGATGRTLRSGLFTMRPGRLSGPIPRDRAAVTIRPSSHRARRLSFEPLELRRAMALVQGVVYDDLNANGVRDAGEPGLGGVTGFADIRPFDGTIGAWETSTQTLAAPQGDREVGSYELPPRRTFAAVRAQLYNANALTVGPSRNPPS